MVPSVLALSPFQKHRRPRLAGSAEHVVSVVPIALSLVPERGYPRSGAGLYPSGAKLVSGGGREMCLQRCR